jgi:peptide chain release factor 2
MKEYFRICYNVNKKMKTKLVKKENLDIENTPTKNIIVENSIINNEDVENISEDKKIEFRILEIESAMQTAEFWMDKMRASEMVRELKELKVKQGGEAALYMGPAVMNILAGAGGDDSEDWARILLDMYKKYIEKNNYTYQVLHVHNNEQNGIRNITIEIDGKGVYGALRNESGVHRLVRISPFNSNSKRHTSFALVEVLPVLPDVMEIELNPDDIEITTQKSGGPGGQNVNKRESAVRIVHTATGLSVHVTEERTQEANRVKALKMLKAKLYKLEQDKLLAEKEGRMISKTTEIEWGNQIRNYVMHPYKLVKDVRTGVETSDIDSVLSGDIQPFIDAENKL